jgi:hydrogenase-4 component E
VNTLADLVLVSVLLMNLALRGTGRISTCIWHVTVQGVVLGLFPLLVGDRFQVRLLVIGVVVLALKGVVFPQLLFRATRAAGVEQEAPPTIGYTGSVLSGIGLLVVSFWLASSFQLPAGREAVSRLVLPVALATLLTGLLTIVTRRQAIMQVVGYLVLENGVFIFGVALAHEEPLLVEMGVLLDVFVAVLVMGIIVFHISRTFDHIDVEQLSQLRD